MSRACFRHDPVQGCMATRRTIADLLSYRPGECVFAAANGEVWERVRVPERSPPPTSPRR
jgi:hypothetical protein